MGGKEILEAIHEATIVQEFHKLYYEQHAEETWKDTRWKGISIAKCPMDLWQYQEIIYETKPDVIIETGTWCGGSALFLRDMLRLSGKQDGVVVTIDTRPAGIFRNEDGIIQLIGDSVGDTVLQFLRNFATDADDKVMVILDSDHRSVHVRKELDIYSRFVSRGMYLIVEDTNVNGHPVFEAHGPGPMEALEVWLKSNTEFQIDEYRQRFLMTFNPKGYCRRLA